MELNRDIDSTLDTAPVCVWRSKREVTGYSVATCTSSAYLIEVDGYHSPVFCNFTVCPGSSDLPEKIFNIFASQNEDYTIY